MANSNFIVHNGLTVGPLSIDAATGAITNTGTSPAIFSGGNVVASSGTASTSTTTGALVVSGGAGVSGNLYVGGNLQVTGTTTFVNTEVVTATEYASQLVANGGASSTSTSTGALQVTGGGGGGITGNLWVGGGINGIIGNGTASAGTFTTLTATSGYQGATSGAHNGTIGANTANSGVFTTLTATSGYQGAASGPLNGTIGASTANTGAFTTLTTTQTIIATGNIVASSSTDSTTATTGSLVVVGGIGVGKNMTITGNITPTANVTYNLGSTTANWNNVYAVTFAGTSTTAKYADLAENYTADAQYEPGTVVDFGGTAEVTLSNIDGSAFVAGVITTNPAHLMNSTLDAEYIASVALTGRVPCKIRGPVCKGQMIVSAGNGRARAEQNPRMGSVIGKALENFPDGEGVIEVVVGRL